MRRRPGGGASAHVGRCSPRPRRRAAAGRHRSGPAPAGPAEDLGGQRRLSGVCRPSRVTSTLAWPVRLDDRLGPWHRPQLHCARRCVRVPDSPRPGRWRLNTITRWKPSRINPCEHCPGATPCPHDDGMAGHLGSHHQAVQPGLEARDVGVVPDELSCFLGDGVDARWVGLLVRRSPGHDPLLCGMVTLATRSSSPRARRSPRQALRARSHRSYGHRCGLTKAAYCSAPRASGPPGGR